MDKIDTSYEKLRTNIQKELSKAKNRDEYISGCKSILQRIARRPDGDKFLGVFGRKTILYDFTPELIKETQQQIAEQAKIEKFHDQKSEEFFSDMKTGKYSLSEQKIGKETINTSVTKKHEAQRQVARDEKEIEQENNIE